MFRLFAFLSSRAKRKDEAADPLSALERGDFGAAERLLSPAIAQAAHPKQRAYLLNKRGVARIKLGRRDEARADFESAVEYDGRCAPALTNIGNLLLEDDRVDDAIRAYCDAIAADREYAVAYVNLGSAYKRAGRLDEAVRALRAGLRLEGRKRSRPRERL